MCLKNITPKSMSCIIIGQCPALFETKNNTYIIIGKLLRDKSIISGIKNRISPEEIAIEVPKKLFNDLKS